MFHSSNWLIFFPIATAILLAMQLSNASRGVSRDSLVSMILNQLAIILYGFALLGLSLRASPASVLWMVILAGLLLVLWWKQRPLDRSLMLLTIQSAEGEEARQQVLASFSQAQGLVRRKALQIQSAMQQGLTWDAAVERAQLPATSIEQVGVRLQARFGVTPFASDDCDASSDLALIDGEVQRLVARLMIFSWTILLGPLLAIYFIFLLPDILSLYEEMGMEVPWVLSLFAWLSDSFNSVIGGLVSLLFLLCYLFLLLPVVFWLFPGLASWPWVRYLFSSFFSSIGFHALAHVSRYEPDLHSACLTTSEVVPAPFVAQQYRLAARYLRDGLPPETALAKGGVASRGELSALAAGLRSPRPAWALGHLAAWKADRLLRRYQVIVQYLVVAATCLLAVIIGMLAVGTIQALASLILETSTWS